jgi:hypothetical protein
MPIFYLRRLRHARRIVEKLSEFHKSCPRDAGLVGQAHRRTDSLVEHPLRYLEAAKSDVAAAGAENHCEPRPPLLTAHYEALAEEWMPGVPDFTTFGFVGIVSPSCTTGSGHIRA